MRNGSEYIRRELIIRLVRLFKSGRIGTELDQLPIIMRPKDGESSRCCLYHDRAVLRYRLMSMLGFSCDEETDETRSLQSYYAEALKREKAPSGSPLSVCSAGCYGCPDSAYVVTGNCRGCFSRPCKFNCPKDAISIVNQVSQIDYSKCIKCGKCQNVCPFHAIIKTTVPCEEACPVGAIRKNSQGRAEIDFDKCTFCGKCFQSCPFGAVMERSHLIDVLNMLEKKKRPVIALVAPAAYSQFPGTIEQLFSAIVQVGFTDVMEVALGASRTTVHEAAEFREKMKSGQTLMTTSCCPAYVELVKKHYPDFAKYVSETPSPMKFAAELAREKYPDAVTVFIGPCIAKRHEAVSSGKVDYVLTFEELGGILAGCRTDLLTQSPFTIEHPADAHSRNYARSCGVTEAVLADIVKDDPDFKLNSKFINGIDKKTLIQLKMFAAGKIPVNFLEVMSCEGGCVNGPCSLCKDGK